MFCGTRRAWGGGGRKVGCGVERDPGEVGVGGEPSKGLRCSVWRVGNRRFPVQNPVLQGTLCLPVAPPPRSSHKQPQQNVQLLEGGGEAREKVVIVEGRKNKRGGGGTEEERGCVRILHECGIMLCQ